MAWLDRALRWCGLRRIVPKKAAGLFDPHFVYPQDEVGPYVDLNGLIAKVDSSHRNDYCMVTVITLEGEFSGYAEGPMVKWLTEQLPHAHAATIRVYDAGGGWYPDNRIISLSRDGQDFARNHCAEDHG